MPSTEVSLPDHVESEIDRLVAQDEFVSRDQAVEELLSLGISAYSTAEREEEAAEDVFNRAVEDQQDPAMRDDPDEYTF
jgi:Arc/MetJ-type ribon-helix-helix transcriptional regulator